LIKLPLGRELSKTVLKGGMTMDEKKGKVVNFNESQKFRI